MSIDELTVATPADATKPPRRRRPARSLGVAMAAVTVAALLVVGALGGRSWLAGGDNARLTALAGDRGTSSAAHPPKPAKLAVHVTLSATTIHYGESVVVTYSWSDGDGTLLDVNQVGSGAVAYAQSVPCAGDATGAQPISGHGQWTYVANNVNVGSTADRPYRVRVGLQVRTGGCGAPEDRTAAEWVTVLPPSA